MGARNILQTGTISTKKDNISLKWNLQKLENMRSMTGDNLLTPSVHPINQSKAIPSTSRDPAEQNSITSSKYKPIRWWAPKSKKGKNSKGATNPGWQHRISLILTW
jgi:hypothetical protein